MFDTHIYASFHYTLTIARLYTGKWMCRVCGGSKVREYHFSSMQEVSAMLKIGEWKCIARYTF